MPSHLRRELGNNHRRSLFHRARKQAIKTPPSQSPTRFHISHLISPNNWTRPPAIILSDPRFHGSPAILFHKARKAGSGVPHDRKAKDQVYSNVRPGPLPSRNFQGKSCNVPPYAASKGPPGGSKTSNARNKMQENDIMCRTDSFFLGLLGLGASASIMQDSPLAKRKLFIKLS